MLGFILFYSGIKPTHSVIILKTAVDITYKKVIGRLRERIFFGQPLKTRKWPPKNRGCWKTKIPCWGCPSVRKVEASRGWFYVWYWLLSFAKWGWSGGLYCRCLSCLKKEYSSSFVCFHSQKTGREKLAFILQNCKKNSMGFSHCKNMRKEFTDSIQLVLF